MLRPKSAQADLYSSLLIMAGHRLTDGMSGAMLHWQLPNARCGAADQFLLLATAPPADGSAISVVSLSAATARSSIAKLTPSPWPTDRGQATEAVIDWSGGFSGLADIRWLSDGLDGPGADTLSERLSTLGRVTIYGATGTAVTLLRPPRSTPKGLEMTLERSFATTPERPLTVRGLDDEGQVAG